MADIPNAPPPRIRRKLARPHKATLNDTRLEAVELVLIQYFQSPQGRSMGRTFRRIPTPDNPFVVSYIVADDEFAGTIGKLELAALPNAVRVTGQIWRPDETQMNAFMARMATAEGQFYALRDTHELFGALLTMPPGRRLVELFGHIAHDVWRPIAQDIIEFLSASFIPVTPPTDTTSTPYGPRIDTQGKLNQLILYRAKCIQDNEPIPTRTQAYQLESIHADTVKKYARKLHNKWNSRDYLPKSLDSLDSLNS